MKMRKPIFELPKDKIPEDRTDRQYLEDVLYIRKAALEETFRERRIFEAEYDIEVEILINEIDSLEAQLGEDK